MCFGLFFGGPFFAAAVSLPLRGLLCDDISDQAVTMTVLFFVESVAIFYWAWSKSKPERAGECIACSEADAAALTTTAFGGVDGSKIFSTVALVNAGNVMNVDCGEAGVLSVTVPPGTRKGDPFNFTLPDAVQPSMELATVSAQVGEAEAESQGETICEAIMPRTQEQPTENQPILEKSNVLSCSRG